MSKRHGGGRGPAGNGTPTCVQNCPALAPVDPAAQELVIPAQLWMEENGSLARGVLWVCVDEGGGGEVD